MESSAGRMGLAVACSLVLVLVSGLSQQGECMASETGPKAVVIDMLMGEPVPMDVMLEDLASVRVVFLGEVHSIARHHSVQAEILKQLVDSGLKTALGMEMFAAHQQPIMDKWLDGSEPFDHLLRALGLDRWTNLNDYVPLILYARKHAIPIVCLNADDALVRKVARKGVNALTPTERKKLPEGFEHVEPKYERLLKLRLRVHKMFQRKSLDQVVLAQSLRDATMARSMARFLESPAGKERIMVAVMGAGHVNYGFGVPYHLEKIKPVESRIVLMSASGQLVLTETQKKQSVPIEIDHKDLMFIRRPIADYVHLLPLVDKEEAPHQTISSR